MLRLEPQLADLLKGEKSLTDNAERMAFGQWCYEIKRFALSARVWDETLISDPKLVESRQDQYRYDAACAAALAGLGQGIDDPKPDDSAKEKLRSQALDWLKEELGAWEKFIESDPVQSRPLLVKTLQHWRQDTDLVGIRNADDLAKLTEAERKRWQALWAEVDALLKKTQ